MRFDRKKVSELVHFNKEDFFIDDKAADFLVGWLCDVYHLYVGDTKFMLDPSKMLFPDQFKKEDIHPMSCKCGNGCGHHTSRRLTGLLYLCIEHIKEHVKEYEEHDDT